MVGKVNSQFEICAKIEKVKSKNQKNQNFCFQLSAFNFTLLQAPCSKLHAQTYLDSDLC